LDFDEVVRKRKMIRQYDAQRQIPDEIVMKLIKNAHRAPSAGHTQIQEFVIVKNPTIKKEIKKSSCESRVCRRSSCLNCSMF
jgi:nitroreductase